ncbi:MAG: hypothetical protein CR975_03555 [Gammaproteobacteria bacterium]|nr:MAG: hypothetical protein CR975_03555 [Gammaproteobacteria bacterium]
MMSVTDNCLDNHQLNHIAILAGGHSRRMGTNKARLLFARQILLQRLVDDANTLELKTLLCADDIHYPEVDKKITASPDLLDNKSGALSAMQPALEHCYHLGEKWLWVYACDSLVRPSELLPYFSRALIEANHNDNDTMMILPKTEKLLPLIGLYRTDLYAPLKEFLLSGHRRVMQFCTAYPRYEITLPNKLSLCCNFNTPEQFEQGKKQYSKLLEE